jgi:hypothetical protein
MPLQKILFKPGVNRENTRYTTEGGWYDCDKVRFRQGTPEKIGGWQRISTSTFIGVCRSLWAWVTLGFQNLTGVGTNQKFYIENGGVYYDITPIRAEITLTNPFTTNTATNSGGYTTVTVTDAAGGYSNGAYVIFYGASAVGGVTVNGEYQLTYVSGTTYTILVAGTASSNATGGGTVYAVYQINTGPAIAQPLTGWGAGAWGAGAWGIGATSTDALRIWNQNNFGEDLIYGPRGGPLYYWNAGVGLGGSTITVTIATPAVVTSTINLSEGDAFTLTTTGALPTGLVVGTVYYARNVSGTTFNLSATPSGALINTTGTQSPTHSISPRGVLVSSLTGASDVPLTQNFFLVSDASRFTICFGTNDYLSTTFDPMLVRWSDQESVTNWTPAITNQAGSIRLSHGSEIITAMQSRQEILIWTDSSMYSLQYLGPPFVWGNQLLADNVSIAGPNASAIASGVVYWMGIDKFYKYDGRTNTLRCDLRQYIFQDINTSQAEQIFASTNEGFNEVWWFYCSANSTSVDKYVVYNYLEDAWYYGTMARTAWLDSGLRQFPIAATYTYNLVNQESGVNDNETGTELPINAYITSSEFDIGDGHNFGFVWRMLPDITFRGSETSPTPQVTMTLLPLQNSGSGYNVPPSVGGVDFGTVARIGTYTIEQFTGQINTRVRGRQMSFKVESDQLGTAWQLGAPRIDIRPDGRRGS